MRIKKGKIFIGDIYKLAEDKEGRLCGLSYKENVHFYQVGDTFVELDVMTDSRANFKYFESKIGKDGKVHAQNNNMFLSENYVAPDGYFLRDVEPDPNQDKSAQRAMKKLRDPSFSWMCTHDIPTTPIEMMAEQAEGKMVR